MENDALARLAVLTQAMAAPPQVKARANIMLYGLSGAGKSHLALEIADLITAPGKAIFHIDTSDNKDRVLEYVTLTHPYANLPFTTLEDLRILTDAMAEGIAPYDSIGTIILDEASTISKDDLDRVYEARVKAIEAGQIKMPKEGMPATPDWADYRPALQRYRSMMTNLAKIPGLNIIQVAHEIVDPKQNNMIVPDFSNEIRKKVKAPLHLLARLQADDVTPIGGDQVVYQRSVQINPTKAVDAKSCLGVPNIRFEAQYLPQAIKAWLDRGAIEHTPAEPVDQVSGESVNVDEEVMPEADEVSEEEVIEFTPI